MSAMAIGSIAGYAGGFGTKFKTRKRKKMTKQEKKLRLKIRESLQKYFEIKSAEHEKIVSAIIDEHHLRIKLRNMLFEEVITEAGGNPGTDVHDNTGINTLKDLLKNTNVLATLRESL